MKDKVIIDVLIENVTTDQNLLNGVTEQLEPLLEKKQEITDRLKNHRRDVSVLLNYADDEGRGKLEGLGFSMPVFHNGPNPVASVAFDLVQKAKGGELTNGALYAAYVDTLKDKDTAVSYTDFNIKCRSLFNSQKLLRTKDGDPKSSRDDIISLNGRVKPAVKKKGDEKK